MIYHSRYLDDKLVNTSQDAYMFSVIKKRTFKCNFWKNSIKVALWRLYFAHITMISLIFVLIKPKLFIDSLLSLRLMSLDAIYLRFIVYLVFLSLMPPWFYLLFFNLDHIFHSNYLLQLLFILLYNMSFIGRLNRIDMLKYLIITTKSLANFRFFVYLA